MEEARAAEPVRSTPDAPSRDPAAPVPLDIPELDRANMGVDEPRKLRRLGSAELTLSDSGKARPR